MTWSIASFFLNSTLHVIILLTILSLFFFLYVSKLSATIFKNELSNILSDNFIPAVRKADKDGKFRKQIQKINLDAWIDYYKNTEEDVTTIENQWLKRSTMIVIGFLIAIFFLSVALLSLSQEKLPILAIIRDNIILFFFVGLIEIMFFYYIARRYIPVSPSVMISTIITTLKKDFA